MKRIRKIIAVLMILSIVLAFPITESFARWSSEGATINVLSIGTLRGRILEVYENNPLVMPADYVTKDVRVQNTGELPALVRMSVSKMWGSSRDSGGVLIENPEICTDNIILNYNGDDWFYDSETGYFYYGYVLAPGEISRPLINGFTLDGYMTDGSYSGLTADIDCSMEMVQSEGNGAELWGMETSMFRGSLMGENDETDAESYTTVEFFGPDRGFLFVINEGDLFMNFKNLVPGTDRYQEIHVTNSWNESTELFLLARVTEQSGSASDLELIDLILREYAEVSVSNNGEIIYSGPVWGNLDSDTDSMKNRISLGRYMPGESSVIEVRLILSPEVGNEFEELIGKVEWVFLCEDGSVSPVIVPQTGDRNITPYVYTLVICGLALAGMIITGRAGKGKKDEERDEE